jgi:hypothetical protein
MAKRLVIVRVFVGKLPEKLLLSVKRIFHVAQILAKVDPAPDAAATHPDQSVPKQES